MPTTTTTAISTSSDGIVSYRISTEVLDGAGNVVGYTHHRGSAWPGAPTDSLPADVQAACAAAHTGPATSAYEAAVLASIAATLGNAEA